MKPPDPWRMLLDKASQDERAADGLATFPDSAPEIVGFHLQQAAEKMLKAALGSLGVAYRYTHNLGELMRLLEVNGHPVPQDCGRLRDLTPYAIEWRYDFVPPEGEDDLDLGPHREMVRRLHVWVEALLHERENQ